MPTGTGAQQIALRIRARAGPRYFSLPLMWTAVRWAPTGWSTAWRASQWARRIG
jgi:hypothetical protein